MKKYLTGMKRKAERDADNETNVSLPKAKTRKYDEAYVALGFTVTTVGDEERPQATSLFQLDHSGGSLQKGLWKEGFPYTVMPCKEKSFSPSPDPDPVSSSSSYNLTLCYPFKHGHLDAQSQLPSSSPSSQLTQQIIGSLHNRGPVGWNISSPPGTKKCTGPVLAADRRYPDKIHHHCSSSTNPYSTSRLKEESLESYTLDQSEVSEHPCPHATKDCEHLNLGVWHNTKGAEGPHGYRALACPLLSGLVLGKGEQGGLRHSMDKPLPVQMALEQRRRLSMMEAPFSHPAAGHAQYVDGLQQWGSAAEVQPKSAEDDRRKLTGMGVGFGFPAHAPYTSLNFHKVLSKHGSIKGRPFTTLSHLTDSDSCHGKASQSPSSSSSPESHREIPHYIGTTVIITNER